MNRKESQDAFNKVSINLGTGEVMAKQAGEPKCPICGNELFGEVLLFCNRCGTIVEPVRKTEAPN